MYYTSGLAECLSNLLTVAKSARASIDTRDELKRGYQDYIAANFTGFPEINSSGYEFVTDPGKTLKIKSLFRKDGYLNDKNQHRVMDLPFCAEACAKMQAIFEPIMAKWTEQDADLAELFSLYVNYLIVSPSSVAKGGTSSLATSVIWLAHDPEWTADDVEEILVHELTHNLLFVDERIHEHYVSYNEIAKRENYARSAILKEQRPLDKVLHSMVVGYEVFQHREAKGTHALSGRVHPTSDLLWQQIDDCRQSILNLSNLNDLLTPRALEFLEKCAR